MAAFLCASSVWALFSTAVSRGLALVPIRTRRAVTTSARRRYAISGVDRCQAGRSIHCGGRRVPHHGRGHQYAGDVLICRDEEAKFSPTPTMAGFDAQKDSGRRIALRSPDKQRTALVGDIPAQ